MNHDFALEVKYDGSDNELSIGRGSPDFKPVENGRSNVLCEAGNYHSDNPRDLAGDQWAVWIGEDGESFHDHYAKHELDGMIDAVSFDDDTIYVSANGVWQYGL